MTFYGTVHSFISINHQSGNIAKFNSLTTPSELSNIDSIHVDRVIRMNSRLLGPIPYRGGDVEMQLGLFSIKGENLAGPYLQLLQTMAKTAGVSYINMALPFVEPIVSGINLLCGAQNDSVLEIGLSDTIDKPETGYFVVMRAPRGTISLSDLRLDQDSKLVDGSGKLIADYPYIVFSVEASDHRPDWANIPEIADAHNKLIEAVHSRDSGKVNDAFSAFRITTITNPDLFSSDAEAIVKEVDNDVSKALPEMTTVTRGPPPKIRGLDEISLFQ